MGRVISSSSKRLSKAVGRRNLSVESTTGRAESTTGRAQSIQSDVYRRANIRDDTGWTREVFPTGDNSSFENGDSLEASSFFDSYCSQDSYGSQGDNSSIEGNSFRDGYRSLEGDSSPGNEIQLDEPPWNYGERNTTSSQDADRRVGQETLGAGFVERQVAEARGRGDGTSSDDRPHQDFDLTYDTENVDENTELEPDTWEERGKGSGHDRVRVGALDSLLDVDVSPPDRGAFWRLAHDQRSLLSLTVLTLILSVGISAWLWRTGDSPVPISSQASLGDVASISPIVDPHDPQNSLSSQGRGDQTEGSGTTQPPSNQRNPSERGQLVVSVVGQVKEPGLVTVRDGSRVADVIAAAGGVLPGSDVLSLNMAEPVSDGDQIVVALIRDEADGYVSEHIGPGSTASPHRGHGDEDDGARSAPGTSTQGVVVNINSATETELVNLPGIGPVTAQAIVAYRKEHGRFQSVDDLMNVDGIGPGKLEKLRARAEV